MARISLTVMGSTGMCGFSCFREIIRVEMMPLYVPVEKKRNTVKTSCVNPETWIFLLPRVKTSVGPSFDFSPVDILATGSVQ